MTRYHPILVILHWLLTLMIIGGLIIGWTVLEETRNDEPSRLIVLRFHMSLGLAILGLMILRFGVRVYTRKPPHADIGNTILNRSGVAVHWLFYAVVIAMCATGIATAYSAGLFAIVFGDSGHPLPTNISELLPRAAHGALSSILSLLILGHVGAALWHQYVRKDRLFGRMWFGSRSTVKKSDG
jgi:cytochrome b561